MENTQISLNSVEFIIFGDFNVLTTAPFRNGGKLEMLPGRKEYLLAVLGKEPAIRAPSLRYAITGNKGGVAFGLQSEDQAREELRWTAEQIGATAWAACFGHPAPKAGYEQYAAPEHLDNRKPRPGMLEYLIEHLGVARERVLVVGTYADDGQAARAAGLRFQVHGAFFREVGHMATPAHAVSAGEPALPPLDLFDIDAALETMEED